MPQFVQHDTAEDRHDERHADHRSLPAVSGRQVLVADPAQQQQKGPVQKDADSGNGGDPKRTVHANRLKPKGERLEPAAGRPRIVRCATRSDKGGTPPGPRPSTRFRRRPSPRSTRLATRREASCLRVGSKGGRAEDSTSSVTDSAAVELQWAAGLVG